MSKLTKILEYHNASKSKRKELLDSFPQETKELLLSEQVESGTLVQSEVLACIVDGAKSRQSARNVVPIINTNSNTCSVAYGGTPSGQYAPYVAESAAIPIRTNNYDSTDIVIKKIAIRPLITMEMIEDGNYGMIELELRRAGVLLENKLNQEIMTTLLDGTTVSIDPIGSHMNSADMGLAKAKVDDEGWLADGVLLEPKTLGYMIDESSLTDVTDINNNLIGLKAAIVNCQTDGTGTAYWDGTDANNHYGGIVFDTYNYAVIAMKEDINAELYLDPIHDLVGMVVSMRFGVGILNENAACKILSKTT